MTLNAAQMARYPAKIPVSGMPFLSLGLPPLAGSQEGQIIACISALMQCRFGAMAMVTTVGHESVGPRLRRAQEILEAAPRWFFR